MANDFVLYRYWRASTPSFPHVMLRPLESGCDGGNAYTGPSGMDTRASEHTHFQMGYPTDRS